MFRCAIIDLSSGKVSNVIEYESVPVGVPPGMPENTIAIASEKASVGWNWDGSLLTDPTPPSPASPITANNIKAEAQRRIIVATGAADLMSCLIKQLNAQMRANELNDKRISGDALTDAELTEAASLRMLATRIKAIRAASNVLENVLPADYTNDSYWI